MKKLIYLVLALVIIAGIAFLLGNTKLFKGAAPVAFDAGDPVVKEIPAVDIGESCLEVILSTDTTEFTQEEFDAGANVEMQVSMKFNTDGGLVVAAPDLTPTVAVFDPTAPAAVPGAPAAVPAAPVVAGPVVAAPVALPAGPATVPGAPATEPIEPVKGLELTKDFATLRFETTGSGQFESALGSYGSPYDMEIIDTTAVVDMTYTNASARDTVTATILNSKAKLCTNDFIVTKIERVNTPPVAMDDFIEVDQRFAAVIDVLANDIDDGLIDPTTVEVIDQPLNGTVNVNNTTGVITYSPDQAAGFVGLDTFTYQMSDEEGLLSDGYGMVTVTVTAPPTGSTPDPEPDEDAPDLADIFDVECEDDFEDIRDSNGDNKWYTLFVCNEFQLGIFEGKEEGFFFPNDEITIAEFLKAFLLTANVDVEDVADNSDVTFPDVKEGKWYHDYMVAAGELGIYEKSEDAPGRPNDEITRREAFIIIADLFGLTADDYEISDYCTDGTEFDDGSDAVATLMQMVVDVPGTGDGTGLTTIVTGNADGTCDLDGELGRDDASALVIRALLSPDFDTLELDDDALQTLQ